MQQRTIKSFLQKAGAAALLVIASTIAPSVSNAQFAKAVVVMSGTVRAEDSERPTSAKVSIRAIGDTAREITSSTSNSQTGKYLVVLKPGKEYWVHIEADSILTKDVKIVTPETADRTIQIQQDFSVVLREVEAPVKKETN
jgi:hypothetical protein